MKKSDRLRQQAKYMMDGIYDFPYPLGGKAIDKIMSDCAEINRKADELDKLEIEQRNFMIV